MKHLLFSIFLCCTLALSAQTNFFVSAARSDDSGEGTSWETAKQTITAAIATAHPNGSDLVIIHVMVGYYELPSELVIPTGVTIRGGYLPNSTGVDLTQRRNPGNNSFWSNPSACTILSGQHLHRVATVQNGGGLEACVVRDGLTSTIGGGLLIQGGSAFNNVITNCMAYNQENMEDAKGGGVYLQSGSLTNCVVCFNRAGNGYGVAGMGGSAISNTITQNYGIHCGTLVDIDHNEYETVIIGEQCWMRENLRTTRYADGDPIAQGMEPSALTPYYYNPATVGTEIRVYGLLYNLRAARRASHDSYSEANPSGMQGVCPDGWHLPSNAEFNQMLHFLSLDTANTCGGSAGNLAKSLALDDYWHATNVPCAIGNSLVDNNLSMFSSTPAGYYDGSYQQINQQCRYWTSSRESGVNSRCIYRGLSYDQATVTQTFNTAEYGCSVRCVKDN